MKEVIITAPFNSDQIQKIEAVSTELKVEVVQLENGRWPAARQTTAEIFYAAGQIPTPKQAPNLRWIQSNYAGINNLRTHPFWNSDVILTTASGVCAPNLAQYVITQLLVWVHHVPLWLQNQQQTAWPNDRFKTFAPTELRSGTLGIIGYGSIGREVARLAKGFGMTVLATKRDARQPADSGYCLPGTGDPAGEMPDRIYPNEAVRSMIADCDYVVITAPLTEQTHHLFNKSLFKEMKPGAFLINVGRGAIIHEADLIQALKKGWLAGAGLDVFAEEPLAPDSPLWQMENVVLTPHVSGITPHYLTRAADLFAENLRRYLAGSPLLNLVDRENGY